jgi:hypothetical protein
VSATLDIRDTGEGISACVTVPIHLWRIVWEVAGGSVFIVFLTRSTMSKVLLDSLLALVVFLIVKDIVSSARGTEVELLVTAAGFVSSGHAPGGYSPGSIAMDDISNLRYRAAEGGGDDREYPSGLYVELYRGNSWSPGKCVLPHLDEAQTNQAIEAIRRRFPDVPFGAAEPNGLILLNLNKPEASRK